MTQDKKFLGTEPVGRLLWRLAVPTVIAQLVNMLYNIVDRIYIGHIPETGSMALTGVGVCLPIIMIISAFAAFVSSGGAPRASIAMGRGDYDQAQRILGGCFTLQVAISLVLTAVLLIWNRPLLLAFGASGNTIEYAAQYMGVYALGTLFVELTLGLNAFITAQGFAQVGMKTVLIPKDNEPDLYEVDDEVKKNLTFLPMQSLTQVLNAALLKPQNAKKAKAPSRTHAKKKAADAAIVPPTAEKPQPGAVC